MILDLLFRTVASSISAPSVIGYLPVDVTIEETHQRDATATEFPIEGGATITDHVRLAPERLSMTGFITDTPLKGLTLSLGGARVATAISILETLYRERTPFRVVSQLKIYENMIIESLILPLSREGAIRFSATFRKLEFVIGQNVLIPDGENSAKASANGGGASGMTPANVAEPRVNATTTDSGRQVPPAATPSDTTSSSLLYDWFN